MVSPMNSQQLHFIPMPSFNRRSAQEPLVRAQASLFLTAIMVFFAANIVRGRDSQFVFDAQGNLEVQATEIVAPPQILGQPQNQIAAPGALASFFVVVADTRELTYQ